MNPPSVPELLHGAAARPPWLSPLDAVMGEDWAVLSLGRAARSLRLDGLEDRGGERAKTARRSLATGAVRPVPQAMVKLISGGGVRDVAGLKAQMAYLGREGTVALRQSESSFGVEIEAEDIETLARSWRLTGERSDGADRTSHFVVSFPAGTDPAAAERAGRAWAEEMFDSGAFGDRWDYYTAFHTDTDFPHIHVVVARRGLDEGAWLKVSRRSAIDYEVLREVQVAVAAREGIELIATPRLARGEHARPIPDAEYRRAAQEGRVPAPPAHTEVTAVRAAAAIVAFARQYAADARLIEPDLPRLAATMERASARIMQGLQLPTGPATGEGFDPQDVAIMTETIEERRVEIVANFQAIDADIATITEPVERVRFRRAAAEIKADAAALLPDQPELQAYRTPDPDRLYGTSDLDVSLLAGDRDDALRGLARGYGLDPDASLERNSGAAVSLGLRQEFEAEETRERANSRRAVGLDPEDPVTVARELGRFRNRVAELQRDAARERSARERSRGRDDGGYGL